MKKADNKTQSEPCVTLRTSGTSLALIPISHRQGRSKRPNLPKYHKAGHKFGSLNGL